MNGGIVVNKITKRIGTAIIAAAVVMSSAAFGEVFAADSSRLEAAIVSAKSVIDVPEEFSEFDSNIIKDEDGTAYELSWRVKDSSDSISVTVNANGDITSYYLYRQGDYSREDIGFSKLSVDEVSDKATKWLERVNPGWMGQLKEGGVTDGGIHGRSSYVRFERYVNGIKFLNDGVSIDVDKNSGEIKNMSADWTYEKDIPDPSEAMEASKANDEFIKLSPVELVYVSDDGKTAKPVYRLTMPYAAVDARKGGELETVNRVDRGGSAKDSVASGGSGAKNVGLTESEIKNLEQIEGLKSEDELKSAALSLYGTDLSSALYEGITYRRTRDYYIESDGDDTGKEAEYRAELSFVFDKDKDSERRAYVGFDAKTGEFDLYYSYETGARIPEGKRDNNDSEKNKNNAKDRAEKFAAAHSGADMNSVKLENCEYSEYDDSYSITFGRYENEINFPQDFISISVNAKSGRIIGYYKSWSKNMKFESADGLINKEEAEETAKANLGLELSYRYSYKEDGGKINKTIELAYSIDDYKWSAIDAKTGELILYSRGGDSNYPSDISGHYAENQIKTLIDNGISLSGGEEAFRPDDVITLGDLTALAASLKNGYFICGSTNKAETLVGYDMLSIDESYNASAQATRADGVKYIIRALGYRRPAELSGIYKCDFSDSDNIPEDILGYAALAKGFGIVNGDENGCFNAEGSLTRADAMIMIYNYLSR